MSAQDILMAAAGTDSKTYIEDVFSTYLYTGNGSTQTINNGIALADGVNIQPGEALGGGYFAGIIKQGGTDYAVIVAPKASGESPSKQWNTTNAAGPTATQTLNNGPAASLAMSSATYPAAQFCEGLSIGGYTDWYLPARDELELCYRNLKPDTTANTVSARSKSTYTYPEGNDVSGDTMGINRNSIPTGAAYTSGSPAQTSVTLFKTGNTEAFAAVGYWSSSEYSATYAWIQFFSSGDQTNDNKYVSYYVRAVRRIPVSDAALDPYRVTGKGGMVWIKSRSAATNNFLFDTARGALNEINSNTTDAQASLANSLTAFNSDGFNLGSAAGINVNAATYASWTFRKAPKFFDVVTYTGNGVAGRTISHSLGVAPGMVIVKCTSTTGSWAVWHRAASPQSVTYTTLLQQTDGWFNTGNLYWGASGAPNMNASTFTIGNNTAVNFSGEQYVAYLFAHDTTTDGLIQCGSYTGTGATNSVTLGWEPQYVLIKSSSQAANWVQVDNMRGFPDIAGQHTLFPNTSDAEAQFQNQVSPTSTGFKLNGEGTQFNQSGQTYIYMAIRRGPMRTPTDGTKVFNTVVRTGTGANATVSPGFVTDAVIEGNRTSTTAGTKFGTWDRLRSTRYLITNTTAAEVAAATTIIQENPWDVMDGYKVGTTSTLTNASSNTFVNWMFKRAPGFFDVVCYTGNGTSYRQIADNLGAASEMVIIKSRNSGLEDWLVWHKDCDGQLQLNLTNQKTINSGANLLNTVPSSTRYNWNSLTNAFSLNGFFAFAYYTAGQYLVTDLGAPMSISSMSYCNGPGGQWGPTSVLAQSSSDGVSWTTEATYSDNNTNTLQTISFNAKTARYWRLYQNSNTRGNSGGYEWHINKYSVGPYTNALTSTSTYTTTGGYYNQSGQSYVAYLFASCPGVSKVGSYTGNGSSQTINCGFTGGARFVLIKRTDSTGDWYVWDTARGMVAGTDPRLALNSFDTEANANWVYTTTGGFQIVTSDSSINASGGSYIYLAVA